MSPSRVSKGSAAAAASKAPRKDPIAQERPAAAKSKSDVPAPELIDRYIAEHADWRGDVLTRIRAVFHAADAELVEEWKWMGSPVFSHAGIIAVANAHKDKVKVTFYRGAELPDPQQVFNNGLDGNKWRAIDLHEGDALDEAGLKALVRSAVALNLSRGK